MPSATKKTAGAFKVATSRPLPGATRCWQRSADAPRRASRLVGDEAVYGCLTSRGLDNYDAARALTASRVALRAAQAMRIYRACPPDRAY